MPPKKIPTVIFDLGGVYFTDGTDRAITVISEKYMINRQAVLDIFYGEVGMAYRENKISIDKFWKTAKQSWKIESESTDELIRIWHEGYVPIEGVNEIIVQLKAIGIETLYLSGTTKERVEYLENKYQFLQYFDDGVFTFTVGVRKPNILPYQSVLQKTSNVPHNCIVVDNRVEYVIPAKVLGMHAILFTDADSLRAKLNHTFAILGWRVKQLC